ncbi:MAG: PDZ domain-containing protein [Parachlamydiaceae bacterium]|nr:PDZ domain-containing protein [Parachlamydiaceae bacterium]
MLTRFLFIFCLMCIPFIAEATKLPQLTPSIVTAKINEIMKSHASYKQLDTEVMKRTLQNYIELLDPNKTYFLEIDISQWINPSPELLDQVLADYNKSQFLIFFQIHDKMIQAINRRHLLEKEIDLQTLPKHVSVKEFKDLKWAHSEQELLDRWSKIRALQIEASLKMSDDLKEKALQRIAKSQTKYEGEILDTNTVNRERKVLTNVLKATSSALDAHTAYFTPDEASQFMIHVQQRLFGIGAQLRDDINGFTITKIIEGGPAAEGKELKLKDRVIAVNGEPVVGMDIIEAVDLIRGEKGTPVTLTVIREVKEEDKTREERKDIVIRRNEVVLKETRYSATHEPFGNGIIGYLRLYSFYQDSEFSSAIDLAKAINDMKKEGDLQGVILDLRYNTGGLLTQAVEVAGLFITKGPVVSVKDHTGAIQHLRDLDGTTAWDGPLIILINRASASASEIVAQTLQDYGRALIIGDDHSYGKGTFQTFTLNTGSENAVNPEGEYKVTRGKYYTVSGKTPQLTGVISDIVVPGALSELDVGEKFAKYPLQNDQIKENFDDDLSDVPFTQRHKVRMLYKFNLQQRLTTYQPFLEKLKHNSVHRIAHNKGYQALLSDLKKESDDSEADIAAEQGFDDSTEQTSQSDLQLNEAYNIMKDLIMLEYVAKGTPQA